MNIIRTAAIELTTIPAIAYKQKLASGGAGIKLHRLDQDAVGVYTIDRRGGQPVPYGKVDQALFPDEAVDEAVEALNGLPYSARGKLKISVFEQTKETEDVTEEETNAVDMVESDEYKAIVDRYSDEKGKMNYPLMNKDFIQFASRSTLVGDMVAAKEPEDKIICHIVKNRASFLANKKETLSDQDVEALIETLDEIDPRSAFKELKNYIRRMLSQVK